MKIFVYEICGENVVFISEFGIAVGIWKDHIPPQKKEYYVEIAIEEEFSFESIEVADKREPIIKEVDNDIVLAGELEEYEEDGCATLRLGPSLILIDTVYHKDFLSLVGKYICVKAHDIYIYDEHIDW
ncbi:MAG: hypothetical protein HFJ06_10350 [Lachnospiraceae bacterium]|nr:hypothetical protein [Lachnospiraceae bacterium]